MSDKVVLELKLLGWERNQHPWLLSLPDDILRDIIQRVVVQCSSSVGAMQSSCKHLRELASEPNVYRIMKLDVFHGKSISSKQLLLHVKCLKYGNPEMLYRYAMVDFFLHKSYDTAQDYLRRAVDSGHEVSEYLSCLLKVLHPHDDRIREDGAIKLHSYENTVTGKKYKQHSRWKVHDMIGIMGIRRLDFIHALRDRVHLPGHCGFLPGCWSCTARTEINILFTTKPWLRL